MGRPKQLLRLGDRTLIRRAVETALHLPGPVAVVLGAHAAEVRAEIAAEPVLLCANPHWHAGPGGSIREGTKALVAAYPSLAGILVQLCDQPQIPLREYEALRRTFLEPRERPALVASGYAGTVGVPALFPAWVFPEMLTLSDDAGAKALFARHRLLTVAVAIPTAEHDVDTPDDYRRIIDDFLD
jgi:molybdenum cofactor cytidylyltransferase